MTTPSDRQIRIVRQHARAAAALGVESLPAYRSGARSAGEPPAPPQIPVVDERPAVKAAPDSPAPTLTPMPARADGWDPSLGPVAPDGRSRREVWAQLEAIRTRYEADAPHQHFVTDHHTIVFGDGDPCAALMFVGEAPGAEEDKAGIPFVGRSGQLLEKMIIAMGLSRSRVYIANVLKTRPPNNATPTSAEAAACAPYLYDQIVTVRPRALVTLGLPAARTLLGTDQPMGALRGRWHAWRHPDELTHAGLVVPVMPTFHPAFLLRQYTPENRGKVWSDLQQVMEKIGLAPTGGAGA